jgi:uncharacterized membrane protein YqiK
MIVDFIILLIIILISISILTSILLKFYKKCPPGCLLVVFNNRQDAYGSNFKIVKLGGAYVWPFGGSYVIFDLSPFTIRIDIEKLTDKQGKRYQINLKILLAMSSEESVVQNAIDWISGLSKEQINNLASDLISSLIRSFFAGFSGEEYKNREVLKLNLINVLTEQLEDIGLKIVNIDIVEVKQV